ncbi:MAG: potassium transporter TrkG [Desulfovibrionaceae bacterium]
MRSKLFTPFWLPIWFFVATIFGGTLLLHMDASRNPGVPAISWLDAMFTSTSAVCVTGLAVVDTGTYFSPLGQALLLGLIQLGALGVMTYTSLVFILLGRRVSLTDRLAVGKALLHDPSFRLGRFLAHVVLGTLGIELAGAFLLHLFDSRGFPLWSAVFHSVSAFCNAGFSLHADSLMQWRTHWGINLAFMALITLGGLGFFVLYDCTSTLKKRVRGISVQGLPARLTWHSRIVLSTSLVLVLGGALVIFVAEEAGGLRIGTWDQAMLVSLFQSVTCRTAGFNTVEIGHMTNVSLLFMIALMFIGGSPGSCAGGIKTTTARVIWGFFVSQFKGGDQVRIGRFALERGALSRAVTLVVLASVLVCASTLLLNISEGGDVPHDMARGMFLETLFEVMSAFGTVGLTTGMTPSLTAPGRIVVMVLMMVGRLGPIWLLSALAGWQVKPHYSIPEKDLPLG